MSEKSGVPVSTLSKVEHDRLTLTTEGCDEALVLTVMSSADEEQMQTLLSQHAGIKPASTQK